MTARFNFDFTQIRDQFQGLNGRHPGLWPFLPRLLSFISIVMAVLILGWYFYWKGQQDILSVEKDKEKQLKAQFKMKVQQAINLDLLQRQKEQVANYVRSLERQLPNKAEIDALLSDINQAGIGRGLRFELFKPGQILRKDYYAELPINIKIRGRYHDIGMFVSDLSNLSRIVTLADMELTTDKKDNALVLDAVVKTYRYLDPEEMAAQEKVRAEATQKGAK